LPIEYFAGKLTVNQTSLRKFNGGILRRKGLSIFQKLFIAFFCVALITLIISGVVHYKSKKEFIERTITSQISDNLLASIDYFNKMFTIPIKKDLGFIKASPTLNNLLTSQKD